MVRKKLKNMGPRAKVITVLAFILLFIVLFLFNKATLNGLIPVDYMQDPWPFKQSCEIPTPTPENATETP